MGGGEEKVAEGYFADVEFGAGVVDIDADEVARLVVIENDAFGHFAALDAGSVRKIDVERICFWIIIDLHRRLSRFGVNF